MLKRIVRLILASLFIVPIISSAVLADTYGYYLDVTITDTSGTARTYLPVRTGVKGANLNGAGYIAANGLDTNVKEGSTERIYMMGSAETLFVLPALAAFQEVSYRMYLGNDPAQTSFPIVTGVGGYITISDASALELGDNFKIEIDGYLNTAVDTDKRLLYKEHAIDVYVDGASEITADILDSEYAGVVPVSLQSIDNTADATWQDIDVSAYVPVGATGVLLQYETSSPTRTFGLQHTSDTTDLIADSNNGTYLVGLDGARKFQMYQNYRGDTAVWLAGYTLGGFEFATTMVDVTPAGTSGWQTVDLTSYVPSDAVGAIIRVENSSGSSKYYSGVRHPDAGYAGVETEMDTQYEMVVAMNASMEIKCDRSNASLDYWYIGAITSDGDVANGLLTSGSGTAKTVDTASSWVDIDCSGQTPSNANYLLFRASDTDNSGVGMRTNGDTTITQVQIVDDQQVYLIECDGSQVVEGYTDNATPTNTVFRLLGYLTDDIYSWVDKTITGTGITSGEQKIEIIANGTNFYMEIDDVEADTVALSGSSVTDNDADWLVMSNNSVPYAEYYKHYVASTLIAHYELNTMVSGTTLVDREGTAQDGTITWGSNSNMTVRIGGIVSDASVVSDLSAVDAPPADTVLEAGQPTDWFATGTGSQLPFYDIFSEQASDMGMPSQSLYVMMMLGVASAVGLGVLVFTGSTLIAAVVCGLAIAAGINTGVLSVWMLFVYIIFAIAIMYLARQQ